MKKTVFEGPVSIGELKSTQGVTKGDFTYKIVDTSNAEFDSTMSYFYEEVEKLLSIDNVNSLTLIKYHCEISMKTSSATPAYRHNLWLCGVAEDGTVLNGTDDFLVAPCPPYCGSGGDANDAQ